MHPTQLTFRLSSFCTFNMLFVEGGIFQMGDLISNFDDEKPVHIVEIPSFYLGQFQVTQNLWTTVKGSNPSFFRGENRPVDNVTWNMAKEFIAELNSNLKIKKILEFEYLHDYTFRLPSEAEWEYAGRGGLFGSNYYYCGSDKLKQVGWYEANSYQETKNVGLLLPNELGLHDMSGNVWEWCEDDLHSNYEGGPLDGSPWIDNPRNRLRILRGGSCFSGALDCRPASRSWNGPDESLDILGFRLALSYKQNM